MKTIEVIITPTGETKIETKGFSGSECKQASQFLGQNVGEQHTPEYHQIHSVQQSNEQQI